MKVPEKKRLERKLKPLLPPLIKKLQSGDLSIQDEFSTLLFPYIRLLVNKYSKSIYDDPDSLAGLIITKIIKKINLIDLNKSVLGFISRTAINHCIDVYRSIICKSKKPLLQGLKDITLYHEQMSVEYIPGNSNFDEESLQSVLDDMFTAEDAEIIGLYHIYNKTYDEIAELTGQPSADIKETIELATNVYK